MSRCGDAIIQIVIFCLLAGLLGPVTAADAPSDSETEQPLLGTSYERVDSAHEQVSGAIEVLAKRVDSFFGDQRSFEEGNDSRLQVRLDVTVEEGGEIDFDTRLKGKWVFPETKKRLQLVLESDPREAGDDSAGDDPLAPSDSASDYVLGVERVVEKSDWEIRPSVGVRLDTPLDPYARLRAIRYFDMAPWLARVSGTASWFNSDGVGLAANVDFDRPIDDDLLFRSATGTRWEEDSGETSVAQRFTLFQQLASRAALAYDLGATFDNDPDWRNNDYYARLRYRRLVYKSWGFLEIEPQVRWPEDNDYNEELSLVVRLEANFGRAFRK